jgi:hypothetical protein
LNEIKTNNNIINKEKDFLAKELTEKNDQIYQLKNRINENENENNGFKEVIQKLKIENELINDQNQEQKMEIKKHMNIIQQKEQKEQSLLNKLESLQKENLQFLLHQVKNIKETNEFVGNILNENNLKINNFDNKNIFSKSPLISEYKQGNNNIKRSLDSMFNDNIQNENLKNYCRCLSANRFTYLNKQVADKNCDSSYYNKINSVREQLFKDYEKENYLPNKRRVFSQGKKII